MAGAGRTASNGRFLSFWGSPRGCDPTLADGAAVNPHPHGLQFMQDQNQIQTDPGYSKRDVTLAETLATWPVASFNQFARRLSASRGASKVNANRDCGRCARAYCQRKRRIVDTREDIEVKIQCWAGDIAMLAARRSCPRRRISAGGCERLPFAPRRHRREVAGQHSHEGASQCLGSTSVHPRDT